MSENNTVSYIWTDNEQTRGMIWDSYQGFIENYDNYRMYKMLGKEHRVAMAGMFRHAHSFYEETRCFFHKIKGLDDHQIEKAKAILEGDTALSYEDYNFLRRFFADFMYHSGIKNILLQKDIRSNYDKAMKEYGAQNGA